MINLRTVFNLPFLLFLIFGSVIFLTACRLVDGQEEPAPKVRNVILMINDGAGPGTWEAADYWEYGRKGAQPYSDFPVKVGLTTYPLNLSTTPTYDPDPKVSYDSLQAWSKISSTSSLGFEAYDYLVRETTDSAAAATALSTGVKTYNSAVNFGNDGQPLMFFTQMVRKQGWATGVVTSVDFYHATPAAFGARNLSRGNYIDISRDMLNNGDLDLIMGGGHPLYDGDGRSRTANYSSVNSEDWEKLKEGSLTPIGQENSWYFIETKADFEALANGSLGASVPLLGIPRIASTLQQQRTQSVQGQDSTNPSGVRFIETVPTLTTMTRGALRVLSGDPDGFFLLVEGGATDWAAHAGQPGRLVEETVDFNASVKVVVDWVESSSSWEETMVIVTSDHGNGLVFGTDASMKVFSPVENRGRGVLPGFVFLRPGHTRELVLLWAKGQGTELFTSMATNYDPGFAQIVGHTPSGAYGDNTHVFQVLSTVLK